jgi:hypothetical protein
VGSSGLWLNWATSNNEDTTTHCFHTTLGGRYEHVFLPVLLHIEWDTPHWYAYTESVLVSVCYCAVGRWSGGQT